MNRRLHPRLALALALPALLLLMTGCAGGLSGLLPKAAAQPTLLTLDTLPAARPPATATRSSATLVVEIPRAAPGYDTRDFAYRRRANEIDYYALHQWQDTPARLLQPLMTQALQDSGAFRAVVPASSNAAGDWRLESELLRLQQDHTQSPSVMRMALRARLIDNATRRVLGTRDFDYSEPAASADPQGGAAAAGRAVQRWLLDLTAFCAQTATR